MLKKRILVVDDDEGIRMVVRLVLGKAGFHVSEASGGAEALSRLAAGPSPAYDLVLLDQNMPDMSGRETLTQVRQQAPAMKVIMLSGGVEEELWDEVNARTVRFLPKPFQNHELVQVVQEALDE